MPPWQVLSEEEGAEGVSLEGIGTSKRQRRGSYTHLRKLQLMAFYYEDPCEFCRQIQHHWRFDLVPLTPGGWHRRQ
jgi:hypothetical protein